jgi:uncharacterized protein with von Willebrand factor type A (vWA) domain
VIEHDRGQDNGETAAGARLAPNLIAGAADGGRIAENILQFTRLLRAAGLGVGPRKTLLATEAVIAAGLASPQTLYWTLHAVLVSRRSEHDIFHQAFHLFWRDPDYMNQLLSVMMPSLRRLPAKPADAVARRLAESLVAQAEKTLAIEREQVEIDARGSWSEVERLQAKDFEQMSAAELRLAIAAVRQSALLLAAIRSRRLRPARSGLRLDVRRMLREAGAKGAHAVRPLFRDRRPVRPPLVVLLDISGSMDTYARLFLHFIHALAGERERVFTFLFGTRLTHVTRALRGRDPDAALRRVAAQASDWSGGTRIGASLAEFNRLWARRVLGQNATVLLVTDGLDRSGGEGIAMAARRLRGSCRRLIWLNPLMRFEGYEPLAAGAKALVRQVSEVRRCHNLRSFADLSAALAARRPSAGACRAGWPERR